MLDQLAQVDMSIYFQSLIFIIFLTALLRLHWKMGSFVLFFMSAIKYGLLILVFIYLFLNWASDVNPTLRDSSILIMTLINIMMLWNTLTAAFEVPYRRALRNCVDGTCTAMDIDQAFAAGKKFYKVRYLWTSLSRGNRPWRFLRGIAGERIRDDLHRIFSNLDPQASIFGSNLYFHFLDSALTADKSLSETNRSELQRIVTILSHDPWLAGKTSEFLHHLLAAPEDLLQATLKASPQIRGQLPPA